MSDLLRLREQLEEAQERIRQLEGLLAPAIPTPHEWGLSPSQRVAFAALKARSVASDELLLHVLEAHRRCEFASDNGLKVLITYLRRKIRPYGYSITRVQGVGYVLTSPEDRATDLQVAALRVASAALRGAA